MIEEIQQQKKHVLVKKKCHSIHIFIELLQSTSVSRML